MRKGKERGQSAVELAMLLPVLLLIVLGCLDLGRAFYVRMALINGAREGASYASTAIGKVGSDLPAVEDHIKQDILAEGLSGVEGTLDVDVPNPYETRDPGDPIRVTATYTLPLMTSFLFGGQPLVIHAEAQMAIIGGY